MRFTAVYLDIKKARQFPTFLNTHMLFPITFTGLFLDFWKPEHHFQIIRFLSVDENEHC